MNETGSKIGLLIIVLAMLFLASLLFDATNTTTNQVDDNLLTYEDEMEKEDLLAESLNFEQYTSSGEVFSGELAEVDYGSNPLAKNFEELINSSYNSIGVNFANKYSIVSWSCGLDCQNSVVINVESGDIVTYGIISAFGLSFSPTSNLLIINPAEYVGVSTTIEAVIATDYYEMNDGELKLIAKKINGENLIEDCITSTTTARNTLTNEVSIYSSPCEIPFGWEIIVN